MTPSTSITALACRCGELALTLHAFDGKHLRLRSVVPFAPGQPLSVEVALVPPQTLALKSLGSVRQAEGDFEVRARTVVLSREARLALLAHFDAAAG